MLYDLHVYLAFDAATEVEVNQGTSMEPCHMDSIIPDYPDLPDTA